MLLALETATSTCSVALWNEDGCIAEASLFRPRKHAERLLPMVRDVLRTAEVTIREIEGVAVSKGPGSYTGLRIGASTAKGLAWAADAKLIGVSSLEALAYRAAAQASRGDCVIAAFPSRRQDVYAAVFEKWEDEKKGIGELVGEADNFRLVQRIDEVALPAQKAAELITELPCERLWLVGSERLLPYLSKEVRYLPSSVYHPSAASVARLGWERLQEGRTEDLFTFEPYYLNASSATPAKQTPFEKLTF